MSHAIILTDNILCKKICIFLIAQFYQKIILPVVKYFRKSFKHTFVMMKIALRFTSPNEKVWDRQSRGSTETEGDID